MTPIKGGRLLDSDRTTLATIMDRLVPPVDDLPGAGAMGLAREVEQRARRSRPLRSAMVAVLDAVSMDDTAHAVGGFNALSEEEQANALSQVEESIPGQFTLFLQLVYTVYYLQEPVHQRIGWPTGPLQPHGFEMPPFDDSILETTRKREPFWRKP